MHFNNMEKSIASKSPESLIFKNLKNFALPFFGDDPL